MRTYNATGQHTNVGNGKNARQNGMLWAVTGTVTKPNSTFRTMSRNPECYRASSAAIFAIVCLVPVLYHAAGWLEPNYATISDSGNSVLVQVIARANVNYQRLKPLASSFNETA